MTFLPVVERELRVAARKRSTFWLRMAAALVALVLGIGFFSVPTVARWLPMTSTGVAHGLFVTLTRLALVAALSAGLFFTSDCLSEEKRDGTLGFLFLTDLRGHDVILGKLTASALRALSAILAVFPILAIPLLMGGVSGSEFWRTTLALLNALLFSLAAGLCVSAFGRESQQVISGTFLILLLAQAVGPFADTALGWIGWGRGNSLLSFSSPGYLFLQAGAWTGAGFWAGLLLNQVMIGLLLTLSGVLLRRRWQEKVTGSAIQRQGWSYALKFGSVRRRTYLRQRMLPLDPVGWLLSRECWQATLLWGITILLVGSLAVLGLTHAQGAWWAGWVSVAGLVTLGLYLSIASQSARFFVEGKRSGFIESLLSTPLGSPAIYGGQWRAFLRLFGWPVLLLLAGHLVGTFVAQQVQWQKLAAASGTVTTVTTVNNRSVTNTVSSSSVQVYSPGPPITVTGASGGLTGPGRSVSFALAFVGTVTAIANCIALVWVGMWMGLTSKTTTLAALKTLVFVQVIPWFAVTFISALAVPLLMLPGLFRGSMPGTSTMVWYPLIVSGVAVVLYLAKDIVFVFWARRQLLFRFREWAMPKVIPLAAPLAPPILPQK